MIKNCTRLTVVYTTFLFVCTLLFAACSTQNYSQKEDRTNLIGDTTYSQADDGAYSEGRITVDGKGPDVVGAYDMIDKSITAEDIDNEIITMADIATGAVGSDEVAANSLATLTSDAVSTQRALNNGTITTTRIAMGAVGPGHLQGISSTAIALDEAEQDDLNGLYGHQPYTAVPDTIGGQQQIVHQPRQQPLVENQFRTVTGSPFSTFSIDVDAASYSNVRNYINNYGQLPPAEIVRIEELVNYFSYDYNDPTDARPFSFTTEIAECPWNNAHKLVHIGLQGKRLAKETIPPSNLVFLIDVSGSMEEPQKLPLLKESLGLLINELREEDNIAIVVYAGAAGLVLPSTSGAKKQMLRDALNNLEAGGSTAGGAGIELAYATARAQYVQGGNNRVMLATDGDFNVGISSRDELVALIEKERESGVFLSLLGFGTGNYRDTEMEQLADNGNGNYAYIDNIQEARKVLVSEFSGTLFTIAKDVKLQIEFNPETVQAYRLIGYENRVMAARDFSNDRKDAGELGAGHSVTALYEVVPVGAEIGFTPSEENNSDYILPENDRPELFSTNDIMVARLRYKKPDDSVSALIEHLVANNSHDIETASQNFKFSAAVAEFGLLLRNSNYKSSATFDNVIQLATEGAGADSEGYRKEFVRIVEKARNLAAAGSAEYLGESVSQ